MSLKPKPIQQALYVADNTTGLNQLELFSENEKHKLIVRSFHSHEFGMAHKEFGDISLCVEIAKNICKKADESLFNRVISGDHKRDINVPSSEAWRPEGRKKFIANSLSNIIYFSNLGERFHKHAKSEFRGLCYHAQELKIIDGQFDEICKTMPSVEVIIS